MYKSMKVMKFGGTSVGTPQRMKDVANLINDGEQKLVVLSAMSGTTNSLVRINDCLYGGNIDAANNIILELENTYMKHCEELFSTDEMKDTTKSLLKEKFDYIRTFTKARFTMSEAKIIIGQGELLSTNMVVNYMKEQNMSVCLLPALTFMRTDKNGEPDEMYIKQHLESILSSNSGYEIYVTQGFICLNAYGEMDNLLRGGSDYTASLIGAALGASEIQIWTDIDGMHNNDPRYVDGTKPVHNLSFDEAAELAYFGAKILHPTCVLPAKKHGIPVELLNTMNPSEPGTVISNLHEKRKIKAVAAKDGITVINILSSRMFLAYGFLAEVFRVFCKYKTSIDVVSTSEVGVSVSIDNRTNITDILEELRQLGTVTLDENMCIICVVGDLNWSNIGFISEVSVAFMDIPVRVVSYGGSNYNISYIVRAEDKITALNRISSRLFKNENVN